MAPTSAARGAQPDRVPWHPRPVFRSAFLLLLVACTPHRVTRAPAPPIDAPQAFAGASTSAGAALPDRWWTVFDDPALDRLVARALGGNFDLRAAWARVAQVRALGGQLDTRLPDVSLAASAARSRSASPPLTIELPPGFTIDDTSTANRGSLAIQAGYELDLWRRMGSQRSAAAHDLAALTDDTATIAMTIAAEVTTAWLDLRTARAQAALLAEQLRLTLAQLELLKDRLRAGLGATALDIFQQRSLAAQLRAQAVQVAASEIGIRARLATLCGVTPGELDAELAAGPASLPAVPPVPAVGVPADLLVRRPDVRAARRRVEAADWRVAAAIADRLPALRLSGSAGLEGFTLRQLIETPVYSVLAALTAPLFDSGRRKAKVAEQRAVVEERLAGYARALLAAATEVESALAGERHAVALAGELEEQRTLAAATVAAAVDRYRDGQIDYLPVLQAVQTEQRLGIAVLDARRAHLALRLQLYRALGGTWTTALRAPAPLPLRASDAAPAAPAPAPRGRP